MKQKQNKGITLIALVITIIVMLILVAVTINMAVNGGLFSYAGKATQDTNNAYASEQNLGSGAVTVDGSEYESIDYYLAVIAKGALPENWTLAETLPTGYNWDTTKVTPIVDNATTPHYVPLPKGYSISTEEGEQAVDTGLVIKDSNGNEFVWIPTASVAEGTLASPVVTSGFSYLEPKELTSTWSSSILETKPKYDSQEILTELYGYKEDGETPYFSYANDFKYEDEYAEMVASVNKYHGFYVGRYETTIDASGNIGSVYNTPVLTAAKTMFSKTTGNLTNNYSYRWYGMYYASKTTNYIVGNGTNVQSAMIYGQLWNKTMDFIRTQNTAGKTTYTVGTATSSWHNGSSVVNSGQANAGDVALNIYDLEGNAFDWTQEAYSTSSRVVRGGSFKEEAPAARRDRISFDPFRYDHYISSRLALYIK